MVSAPQPHRRDSCSIATSLKRLSRNETQNRVKINSTLEWWRDLRDDVPGRVARGGRLNVFPAKVIPGNAANKCSSESDDLLEVVCLSDKQRNSHKYQEQKNEGHSKEWQKSVLQLEREWLNGSFATTDRTHQSLWFARIVTKLPSGSRTNRARFAVFAVFTGSFCLAMSTSDPFGHMAIYPITISRD
jgi:hypothetical protein